jgi:hypothetical protein
LGVARIQVGWVSGKLIDVRSAVLANVAEERATCPVVLQRLPRREQSLDLGGAERAASLKTGEES